MKRLILLLILFVNLQIVITHEDMQLFSYSTASAQHMTLEGGYYNCEDDQIGWYLSLIPCEGMIVTPDETYSICTICGEKFQTSEIIDHEYICYLAHQNGDDPFNNSSSNNNGNTGNSCYNGGGSHGSGNNSNGGNGYSAGTNSSNCGSFILELPVPPNTPVGYDGALIAGISYLDENKETYLTALGSQWDIAPNDIIPGVSLSNDITGFKSTLLVQTDEQGNIIGYVYVFAGTDTEPLGEKVKDIITDVFQTGGMVPQYEQALKNAIQISNYLGDIPLTFIGHSLGGGLAAIASMVTGRPAITYNPAGISDGTKTWLKNHNYRTDTSNIYGYIMEEDPVTYWQSKIGIVAQGQFCLVENSTKGDAHSIDNMIKCLQPK